ncbi:MAG: hypothetical protein H6601_07680 [Flavobacteriales bacterium]|nr:hypothetical protein [Flavobacteriales bacterium]
MYRKLLFVVVFAFCASISLKVSAQDDEELKLPEVPKGSVADKIKDRSFDDTQVLLKQEFTGGGMIHTQGWGLLLRRAKNKTFLRKRLFELEAVSMEHPKEIRTVNQGYENSRGYVYGELNQVVVTRLGYGRHNVLYAKFDKGVEIRYLYIGGFSMAWAKPIYLDIARWEGTNFLGVSTERYDPNKTDAQGNTLHTQENIVGSASPFLGIDKMQFYPGMYGKFGFSFEYARKEKSVRSLEAGVIIDYYIRDVPMMAKIKNDPYYLTFYLAFNFGVKWYR